MLVYSTMHSSVGSTLSFVFTWSHCGLTLVTLIHLIQSDHVLLKMIKIDTVGLCLFQAAFECMYTLLDSCLDRLDIFEFLNHVEDGLKDHYDIKMLTYLMLIRLAHLCPSAMLQRE